MEGCDIIEFKSPEDSLGIADFHIESRKLPEENNLRY
jgi:hypothetical protein